MRLLRDRAINAAGFSPMPESRKRPSVEDGLFFYEVRDVGFEDAPEALPSAGILGSPKLGVWFYRANFGN
jgi:hypothetical protein